MIARAAILSLAILVFPASSDAAWAPLGNPVCVEPHGQNVPAIATDGAGGAIITWYDGRNSSTDIYAQHILANGEIDPNWPTDGLAVCTAAEEQLTPQIASDGVGGAFVVWEDYRGPAGESDIYAQHVLATGALDPGWPADALAVCAAPDYQSAPRIAADGAGGAFVVWQDPRLTGSDDDIYGHHLLATGLDTHWSTEGTVVCDAANAQSSPRLIEDGAGGMIAAWADDRGTDRNIYALRMTATGARAPGWSANGKAICIATGDQDDPVLVSDGVNGAIVAWDDSRGGLSLDIYAARVNSNGALGNWPSGGRCLSTIDDLPDFAPQAVNDGAGGAYVMWSSDQSSGDPALMANHVLAAGALHPSWPAGGAVLSDNLQYAIDGVVDGAGGAIIGWVDRRGPNGVVATHLLTDGIDPAWTPNGIGISGGIGERDHLHLVYDGAGAAIGTWVDTRNGSLDIYAGRILASGDVVGIAPAVQAGPPGLRLGAPRPHPLVSRTSLALDLPAAAAVEADVLDVAGRAVRRLVRGAPFSAGRHEIVWDGYSESGGAVPDGVYLVHVRSGATGATQRVVVLRSRE